MVDQSLIGVVDGNNQFLRWETRKIVHTERLQHRSVHVLVFDSAKRLVIQQRHRNKQTFPLYWDASCAGHVEREDYLTDDFNKDLDSVYLRTAKRELLEEINVTSEPELLARVGPIEGIHYEHFYFYKTVSDGPFPMQETEVEAVRLVTSEEFDALQREPNIKVTPLLVYLVSWLRERKLW